MRIHWISRPTAHPQPLIVLVGDLPAEACRQLPGLAPRIAVHDAGPAWLRGAELVGDRCAPCRRPPHSARMPSCARWVCGCGTRQKALPFTGRKRTMASAEVWPAGQPITPVPDTLPRRRSPCSQWCLSMTSVKPSPPIEFLIGESPIRLTGPLDARVLQNRMCHRSARA